MKKTKSDAKAKFPIGPPKFAERGPHLQSQPLPTVASVLYLEKINTPEMNSKQRSKDRVFTCFVESPSVFLGRLLNAKLIKKM